MTSIRTLNSHGTRRSFGNSVACAGDVNGDGYADIIVAAFWEDVGGRAQAGTARVFHGGVTGVAMSPARTFEGGGPSDYFGGAVE